MTAENRRPTEQLVNRLFAEPRIAQLEKLQSFLQDGGNVFDLIDRAPASLCEEFELSRAEARLLLDRSYSLALKLARVFRENQLTAGAGHKRKNRGGLRAMVDGPTFDQLFAFDSGNFTPVDNIGASVSPVAYLISIIQEAKWLESSSSDTQRVTLRRRRPDLFNLLIDETAVNRQASVVLNTNQVLRAHLETYKNRDDDVDALMRLARYPNTLPYDPAWRTIDYATQSRDPLLSLAAVVRATDSAFPYFIRPDARGQNSDIALRLASELSPGQQELLLEDFYPLTSRPWVLEDRWVNPRTRQAIPMGELKPEEFYRANFDCDAYTALLPLKAFQQKTQLSREGIERLLSIGAFVPQLSANAPAQRKATNPDLPIDDDNPALPVTAKDSGSAFINFGDAPAIGLERVQNDPPKDEWKFLLTHLTANNQERFDRINRMVRLNRWLGLNAHETDQLVVAAIRAEDLNGLRITENTLRALGLFKELRAAYGCSAEDFAAFIDVMSAYEYGKEPSHFDRVFNAQSLFATPLLIDNGEFSAFPVTEEDQSTADHICAALGIDFDTYRYLAILIAAAHSAGSVDFKIKLHRSLSVLSSFYRLVRLPRLLGIGPLEGIALINAMDLKNVGWLAQLAGPTRIRMLKTAGTTDVLSVLHAGMSMVQWCQRNELSPKWLTQHVGQAVVPVVMGDSERQLLEQLSVQLQPVRMSELLLTDASVPPDPSGIGWMNLLETVVDANGLIIGVSDRSDAEYMRWIGDELQTIVENAHIPVADQAWVIEAILRVVLRSRAGQRALVQETFAVYLQLPSDLALPVIVWSGGYVYQLLSQALKAMEPAPAEPVGFDDEPEAPDSEQREFLRLLVELQRRSEVARELKLSSAMLISYLENSAWFGIENASELSLTTVFYLTLYGRAVKLAKQPAQKLLDYLSQVNEQLGDISEDEVALVRDAAAGLLASFFGCGIKEVLTCAIHANPAADDDSQPPVPLIRDLQQLALLLRMLETRDQTGLDFDALLILGKLTPKDGDADYRFAAQRALESLSETSIAGIDEDGSELGQSLNIVCEVDRVKLVANVPNEIATYRLTLRDYTGKLLKYVTVEWSHQGEGVLMDLKTQTDSKGQTFARLLAGSTMGSANVAYKLRLRDAVAAPSVLIDCDDELKPLLNSRFVWPQRDILAGQVEYATLRIRFRDNPGNDPVGKRLQWSTDNGIIKPDETFTNEKGESSVRLYSDTAVEAIVTVTHVESGNGTDFPKITFVDQPRITELLAITPAVKGQPLTVMCHVIGLNGKPLAGQPVTWQIQDGTTGETLSDPEGNAYWDVPVIEAGKLMIMASVGTAGQDQTLELSVSERVLISEFASKWMVPVADSPETTDIWIELSDELEDGQPIALYPVEWTQQQLPKGALTTIIIPTDKNGRSTYPFKAGVAGTYQLTAKVQVTNQFKTFDLEVLPAFEWKVDLFEYNESSPPDEVPVTGEWILEAGKKYRLKILPVSTLPAGAIATLGWYQQEGSSAKTIGLEFTPKLAMQSPFPIDGSPLTWDIDCSSRNDRTFRLDLRCEGVPLPLLLEGKVRKKPLSKRRKR
ncbi:Tc toxin subunit A [Pseudomonas atagonensis]|uniref:Tc toxin subunit A n=1 Tax=Pseudomonas atagonensis TaxID=2609964 RepID=UPI00140BE5BA|nr:Tc toxin subunit A [Pseudomonas atagonensis]